MSRKTKKEKRASDLRRENIISQLPSLPQDSGSNSVSLSNTYKFNFSSNLNPKITIPNGQLDYGYVTKDLVRIAVLATLAFCAQLVLWYFLGSKI